MQGHLVLLTSFLLTIIYYCQNYGHITLPPNTAIPKHGLAISNLNWVLQAMAGAISWLQLIEHTFLSIKKTSKSLECFCPEL